jgi:CHASE2 domain-containing sensor protein
MTKLVIFQLEGDFTKGFSANIEIGLDYKLPHFRYSGRLPSNPDLEQCLHEWQRLYARFHQNRRIKAKKVVLRSFSRDLRTRFDAQTWQLKTLLQSWLTASEFNDLDKKLRQKLNERELIRLLLCSNHPSIARLPWSAWDLVENYPYLEIACSNLEFESIDPPKISHNSKVRILAILGSDSGLNLHPDSRSLKSLPDAEVTFLVRPKRQELFELLWQETWEIVFFAGHSRTVARRGTIDLNTEDSLGIDELTYGFRKAIANGLQLAIFNSCDGLGLAEELSHLSLPQAIVMREPVPDIIAQEFLQHFLQAYAGGNSLYLATRNARERLQGWEHKYPCASWLPIIYQNQGFIPPQWHELRSGVASSVETFPHPVPRESENITPVSFPSCLLPIPQEVETGFKYLQLNSHKVALCGILSAFFVSLLQIWGWMQFQELQAFDRLMTWRLDRPASERIVLVTVEDEDIQYQQRQGMSMRGSLSDDALRQLLTKLQPYQPKVIASDIIHDFPYSPELAQTIAASDNFVGICRVKNQELPSIEAPASLPVEQVGFSNFAVDPDGVIRRQIVGMSPDGVCQSDISLSLRLALRYLDDVSASTSDNGVLLINQTEFPQLTATSGAYHLPKTEALGYQILLNYSPHSIETISLSNLLQEKVPDKLKQLVAGKILLIGVKSDNSDLHVTPYSRNYQSKEKLSGATIHAQMTEQIIGTVLGERRLLTWLPEWSENLWLFFWSIVGAASMVWWRSWQGKATAIALALSLLFCCCWVLFNYNIWILTISPAIALLIGALTTSIYHKHSTTHISTIARSDRSRVQW